MKKLRKIIFWCHLPVGVIAGVVILIMCVTGVLLSYEKQITSWADTRGYRSAPPASGAQHLPIETLITKARETRGAAPTSITLKSDPEAPAEIGFGRETTLFANPYTGAILGEGSQRTRSFFRTVTDWHRWLGAKGDNRNVARAITGACNLGFLFLVMSGFYLWWPRNWNLKSLRNVTWFRRGLPSKARDFNWHNVIGFWSAVPLFIVVLSAVVISYTWAGNLVYRIVGETPPAPRAINRHLDPAERTHLNPVSTISTQRGFEPSNRLMIGKASHCNYPPQLPRRSRSISIVEMADNHKSELSSFWIVRRARWFVGNLFPRTLADVSFVRFCASRTLARSLE